MKELYNLCLFLAICFVVYVLFRSFHLSGQEGMTTAAASSTPTVSAPENGIAGNAASYAASLKASTIKLQDMFLVTKYRTDYESAILNLDDLISNLMLKTALSVTNQENPTDAIQKLAAMQQAKTALNGVMKFVDSN
jgi:hypothetical protein